MCVLLGCAPCLLPEADRNQHPISCLSSIYSLYLQRKVVTNSCLLPCSRSNDRQPRDYVRYGTPTHPVCLISPRSIKQPHHLHPRRPLHEGPPVHFPLPPARAARRLLARTARPPRDRRAYAGLYRDEGRVVCRGVKSTRYRKVWLKVCRYSLPTSRFDG
jgi:hypothetical protein